MFLFLLSLHIDHFVLGQPPSPEQATGTFIHILEILIVPDRRSRSLEVVVVRRINNWVLGIWNGEGVGRIRKGRSVYKQPGTRVDGSCHSKEGFQVSKEDWERGGKGSQQGEKKARG
jgi:hypothetical protein